MFHQRACGPNSSRLRPLFPLGRVLMACGVDELVRSGKLNPVSYLRRHVTGDWGDLCAEDKRLNTLAVQRGDRLLSAYEIEPGLKLWIITEWDRSVTTLLLPTEY